MIGNEAENFSAGANLFMMVVGAQQGMWDMLDAAVRKLQDMNMRMRYSPKPVVVAPAGLTLGGGCEISDACLACGCRCGNLYRSC